MWEEYFIYSMANIAVPLGNGTVFNPLQPGFRLDTDADFKSGSSPILPQAEIFG